MRREGLALSENMRLTFCARAEMLKLIKRFDANHVKIDLSHGSLEVEFVKESVGLAEQIIHETPVVTTSWESSTMAPSWVLDFNSVEHQFEMIRS